MTTRNSQQTSTRILRNREEIGSRRNRDLLQNKFNSFINYIETFHTNLLNMITEELKQLTKILDDVVPLPLGTEGKLSLSKEEQYKVYHNTIIKNIIDTLNQIKIRVGHLMKQYLDNIKDIKTKCDTEGDTGEKCINEVVNVIKSMNNLYEDFVNIMNFYSTTMNKFFLNSHEYANKNITFEYVIFLKKWLDNILYKDKIKRIYSDCLRDIEEKYKGKIDINYYNKLYEKSYDPTLKGGRSNKSNYTDMNIKYVKELCKANKIKLSTTKNEKRVIYTKKELLTKLKRKKII